MLRANLLVAGRVEVTDLDGHSWTVHVVRNGDPRTPFVRRSNLYLPTVLLNQLRRLVRRDRSWNVELAEGRLREDLSDSVVRSTESSRGQAVEAAVLLAQHLDGGEP